MSYLKGSTYYGGYCEDCGAWGTSHHTWDKRIVPYTEGLVSLCDDCWCARVSDHEHDRPIKPIGWKKKKQNGKDVRN